MKVIDEIVIGKDRKLQLLQGDLTRITNEHQVDALVVSAFPGNYAPGFLTLIGALHEAGISVNALAMEKEEDLRVSFNCWLSKKVNKLNIKRMICFEPIDRENPYSLIAGVFEGIINLSLQYNIQTIAMPLLMTGAQGFSDEKVARELVNTSMFWLNKGSPLKTIKIVVNTDAKAVLIQKETERFAFQANLEHVTDSYDFFISYSRKNMEAARTIQKKLKDKFNLFFDKESIDVGANWLNKINTSLENSKRFIVCLSPEYIESKVCKYEYTFCNMKLIMDGDDCVLPLYLYSTTLPFHMQILNYHDAREGQQNQIEAFCDRLIQKYAE